MHENIKRTRAVVKKTPIEAAIFGMPFIMTLWMIKKTIAVMSIVTPKDFQEKLYFLK